MIIASGAYGQGYDPSQRQETITIDDVVYFFVWAYSGQKTLSGSVFERQVNEG